MGMKISDQTKPASVVNAGKDSVIQYLTAVWKYRNLIYVFAYQEFKLQYAQTRLYFLWMILRPLMVLGLFTFIFDRLIHLPGVNYPYPLFALSGILIWNSFSFMVNNAGNVILANQQLVRKMYFPRIILVFSKMIVGLAETVVTILLILLLAILIKFPLRFEILLLPLFIFANLIVGLAIAIWLNALTIRFRDLHQITPTLVGFLVWLTPVFYPTSLIPANYSFFIYLNPIAGVIQGCRWAILGDSLPSLFFLPSFAFFIVLLFFGLLFFISAESDLADYI